MEVHNEEEEERSEEGSVGVVWSEGWVNKGHSPGSRLGFLCLCSLGWNELSGQLLPSWMQPLQATTCDPSASVSLNYGLWRGGWS